MSLPGSPTLPQPSLPLKQQLELMSRPSSGSGLSHKGEGGVDETGKPSEYDTSDATRELLEKKFAGLNAKTAALPGDGFYVQELPK